MARRCRRFTDAVEHKLITDEQLWHVAAYVQSLAPDEPPVAREVVRAQISLRTSHGSRGGGVEQR